MGEAAQRGQVAGLEQGAGLHVPAREGVELPRRAVVPGGPEGLPVRAEREQALGPRLQGLQHLVVVGVPDDRPGVVARGQQLAVPAPGHGPEGLDVAREAAEFAASVRVPDLAGAVERGGGQALAVGAEGDLVHPLGVPREARQRLAPDPHLDRPARVGADQAPALSVEGHAPDRLAVPRDLVSLLTGRHVPDARRGPWCSRPPGACRRG